MRGKLGPIPPVIRHLTMYRSKLDALAAKSSLFFNCSMALCAIRPSGGFGFSGVVSLREWYCIVADGETK